MSDLVRAVAWSLASAVGVLLAVAVGLIPSVSPPAPERTDVREALAQRQAKRSSTPALASETAQASQALALPAELVCEEPSVGDLSSLRLGPLGEALLVPCGRGALLWRAQTARPERLARLTWPSPALRLGPAAAADLDGDGHAELLFTLIAQDASQAHREGLYWARGRAEGGFEPPAALIEAPVQRLVTAAAANDAPARLWLTVGAPGARVASELWRVSGGVAPVREAHWPVPCAVADLAFATSEAPDSALLLLCGDGLFRKTEADSEAPSRVLALEDARAFVRLGAGLAVVTGAGLRPLENDGEGGSRLGEPEGPGGLTSAAVLGSGRRLAIAQGALWTWREGEAPSPFGAAGGARVEGLAATGPVAWLWLSGVSGAGSAGVARLADPWVLTGAAALEVRRPQQAPLPAQLSVP